MPPKASVRIVVTFATWGVGSYITRCWILRVTISIAQGLGFWSRAWEWWLDTVSFSLIALVLSGVVWVLLLVTPFSVIEW